MRVGARARARAMAMAMARARASARVMNKDVPMQHGKAP